MSYRETDRMGLDPLATRVTIDRKIPLWGMLTVAGAIIVQAILLWNGQQLQAQRLDDYGAKIVALTVEVKELNNQLSAKGSKDNEQDLRLNEYSRRLLLLEGERQFGVRR
ncbi:MAG: hypothetical protein EOP39_04660 [Rubrivivax sp.]|nr:MAG: hypothetical protein EOP39_04660 [Rubrivivax sp.]